MNRYRLLGSTLALVGFACGGRIELGEIPVPGNAQIAATPAADASSTPDADPSGSDATPAAALPLCAQPGAAPQALQQLGAPGSAIDQDSLTLGIASDGNKLYFWKYDGSTPIPDGNEVWKGDSPSGPFVPDDLNAINPGNKPYLLSTLDLNTGAIAISALRRGVLPRKAYSARELSVSNGHLVYIDRDGTVQDSGAGRAQVGHAIDLAALAGTGGGQLNFGSIVGYPALGAQTTWLAAVDKGDSSVVIRPTNRSSGADGFVHRGVANGNAVNAMAADADTVYVSTSDPTQPFVSYREPTATSAGAIGQYRIVSGLASATPMIAKDLVTDDDSLYFAGTVGGRVNSTVVAQLPKRDIENGAKVLAELPANVELQGVTVAGDTVYFVGRSSESVVNPVTMTASTVLRESLYKVCKGGGHAPVKLVQGQIRSLAADARGVYFTSWVDADFGGNYGINYIPR